MKKIICEPWLVVGLSGWLGMAAVSQAVPVGTGFTYQGHLTDNNVEVGGLYDFQFKLYDDGTSGTQQGRTVTVDDAAVIPGYFSVELDFGAGVFDGGARWLEISVRPGTATSMRMLPRVFLSVAGNIETPLRIPG